MRDNTIFRNGSGSTPDSVAAPASERLRDLWGPAGKTRTIIDASGARTTFIFNDQSHTVMESPHGIRVTLTSCPSQKTVGPAGLSHFAAHVELRVQPTSASLDTPVGAFLGHPESQRHITIAALRACWKCMRWLDDVIQQANLQLLDDLRERKAIFDGDDPHQFARWFHGTSRHASIDAIKHCLLTSAVSITASMTADIPDPNAVEPVDVAMLSEQARLTSEEIERIRESELREVMRDLRDGKTTRESAKRLGISKSEVDRMRNRGCQLIAGRLGM